MWGREAKRIKELEQEVERQQAAYEILSEKDERRHDELKQLKSKLSMCKCTEHRLQIHNLEKRIAELHLMMIGERVCDVHCKLCKHSYRATYQWGEINVDAYKDGDLLRRTAYRCKLDIKCHSFEQEEQDAKETD